MEFIEMEFQYADLISHWQYAEEYAVYSFSKSDDDIEELMNGEYYACIGGNGDLIGYFCVGSSAQIPVLERNIYSDTMLDVGIGMRPDLCGKGNGRSFFCSILQFIKENYKISQLRLTVANFNQRAIHLYTNIGFHHLIRVMHFNTNMPFEIMYIDLEATIE